MSEAIGLVEAPVATESTPRRGFIREVLFGQRAAVVGLVVLLFFVVIAVMCWTAST